MKYSLEFAYNQEKEKTQTPAAIEKYGITPTEWGTGWFSANIAAPPQEEKTITLHKKITKI